MSGSGFSQDPSRTRPNRTSASLHSTRAALAEVVHASCAFVVSSSSSHVTIFSRLPADDEGREGADGRQPEAVDSEETTQPLSVVDDSASNSSATSEDNLDGGSTEDDGEEDHIDNDLVEDSTRMDMDMPVDMSSSVEETNRERGTPVAINSQPPVSC